MTNYSTGHEAEKYAAAYLKQQGFAVKELNWRTKVCEIDIIAQKAKVVYFVEVKHRTHSSQGGGLDYITPTKLKQMQFAAECWIKVSRWNGDYELSAIETSGPNFVVTGFVQNIL